MTDLELYAVPLPERGQPRSNQTGTTEQQLQAILDSDSGDVESIAPRPGERSHRQDYVDEYAEVRAQELKELANGISQPLPLHAQSGTTPTDAYISASRARVEPIDPRGRQQFQRAELDISETGTRASHWRSICTSVEQVSHPFGNTTTPEVGAPADARKIRWRDRETGQTEAATVQATRDNANRNTDIYHADEPSFYDASANRYPELIYDIEYSDIGWTDPRVWDDRGTASRTDANGRTQWQKVFQTGHDYDGQTLIENGLIRAVFDEAGNSLTVEEWDPGTTSWSAIALGASDWELYDINIVGIGLARVRAIVEFWDPTQSPTAYHALSFRLARGYDRILWGNGVESTAVPSELETLLDPTANDIILDAGPEMGLTQRRTGV